MSIKKRQTPILKVFSPAKINLYLHITGKRDDGYHMLDSLVGFVDIGDEISLKPAEQSSLHIDGIYAHGLHGANNLITKTIEAVTKQNFEITLTKNLPIAAGLGGGSSNAAAAIWGLHEMGILQDINHPDFIAHMTKLGADIPVCLKCETTRMRGIGDILEEALMLPEIPIVLVNPNKPCSTATVFREFGGQFSTPAPLPGQFADFNRLILFLGAQRNDLTTAAKRVVPEIANALNQIEQQDGCKLSRLCGSGASCFGLFEHEENAQKAARALANDNPDWWVRSGTLGRPERY